MAESRVKSSVRNVLAAWGGQAAYAICAFVVRAIFVDTLASEYVGLETLFTSLLTILSLADLGVGSAITFALYKPLAFDDRQQVKSLMRLFKRAYIVIGCVVIAAGACMTPFISGLLGSSAPDIPNLKLYFFCFVLNTGISYFFSYKASLITADQKNYVVSLIQYGFQIAMCGAQIAVLLVTGNYLLYLCCMIASTLLQNIVISHTANRLYPYLREKDIDPLDKGVLSSIKKNIVGLLMHRVAEVATTPTSNLIITAFVGLATTSLYGNYQLVTNALQRVVVKLFDSIIASVGNLSAKESNERQYEVFRTTFFINALIYGVVTGALLCAINPFIWGIWLGRDWVLPDLTVILLSLLFYFQGMRCAGQAFTSAYGLYWVTKWKAVLEAVSLPVLMLILVRPLGMNGVLLSGIISTLCISTVYEGWAVYRRGFDAPLRNYVKMFALYSVLDVGAILLGFWICSFIALPGLIAFLVDAVIGMAIPVAVLWLCFHRTREYAETRSIIKRVAARLRHRSQPEEAA